MKPIPPAPKSFWKLLGPSFILLGLGLGSGEVILWPYLASNHGLGIVWGMIIGITIQFFINMEVERYALIYGESIFVGFARLLRLLPLWFIFSTLAGFGWPGIGLAGSTLFSSALNIPNTTIVSFAAFISIGLILTLGKTLYKTVEILQKYLIGIGVPIIILLTFYLATKNDFLELLKGMVGIGHNFRFFPHDLAIPIFFGALAYSGAGGNLNLAQSFYVRDKGYGMGKYAKKISGLFNRQKTQTIKLTGATFPINKTNLSIFKSWWKAVNLEHFLVFFCIGLFTMLTLALLAYITSFGSKDNQEGLNFVLNQATTISIRTFPAMGSIFLFILGTMLLATQLTVLDSTSRIITENIILFKNKTKANLGKIYYTVLWSQIAFGIIIFLSGFNQPKNLIVLGAVLNAAAMFVYTGIILFLNNTYLPKPLRPNIARNTILIFSFFFLGYFSLTTILSYF